MNVHDAKTFKVVEDANALLKEISEKISIATPDFNNGKWVSEDEYAVLVPCSPSTLKNYREAKYNPETLSNGIIRIKKIKKRHHYCRQIGDKHNSDFVWFVEGAK